MRLTGRTICSCCIAALFWSAGCGTAVPERPTDGRLPVFAGIPPMAYLVELIGGPHVAVATLVEAGQDPHTFAPTPRQVVALGRARLFFQIGMPFENALLEKLKRSAPQMEIIDAAAGIKRRMMDHDCVEHDHADHRGTPDPHVWLSPPLLKIEAGNVAVALERADPAHAEDFRRNLDELLARIDAVHGRIEKLLAPHRGRSFYVFHPGFGYFADVYGLNEEAIESGGRPPSPKRLRALVEKARSEGAKTVFIQPQFDPRSASKIADAVGGSVVLIDGLEKDVLKNLEGIAGKIANSFSEQAIAGG
ncbi:MAG: zinc ABC transporter substrate-binding protein [Pirellulales bacterium]|nr:zinc ABC transporter substrate-binding protein [Pirellulales bacterium]